MASRLGNSRRNARLVLEQLENRLVPANAAPVLTTLQAVIPNNGSVVQLNVNFTDADASDPHRVLIDWHDGSAVQTLELASGVTSIQISHFYSTRQSALDNMRSIGAIVTDQAFASQIVNVTGSGFGGDFRSPGAVLGEPTRFTDPNGPFGGAVTPFNAPFGGNEIFMLNDGESVTVAFPVQVFDNPSSEHFGADFLIFGNAFYHMDFNTGKATGGVFSEPGQIEVSQDGVNFFAITTSFADTAFPTNGFQNPTGPFDLPPANPIFTDFGLPVDLDFNETGLTLAQIVAAYNGSGGGTPVDISSTGLEWIKFVRVHGAADGVELDAFSVVNPLPAFTTTSQFALVPTDTQLGLYADPSGFFQSGNDAKWLRGSVVNAHGNTWYFLKTNGDFFAWNGEKTAGGQKIAGGTLLQRFSPDVFVHPELLFGTTPPAPTSSDAAAAEALDETLGLFVGVEGLQRAGFGPDFKWLHGVENSFGNDLYFLDRDGQFFEWNGGATAAGNLLHDFDAQFFFEPQLLHDAFQANLPPVQTNQAQTLDQDLGLFVDVRGFYPKVKATGEKWLRGNANTFGNNFYFLRSNGDFVAWDGNTNARGKKIATGDVLFQFDQDVFLNPALLFQAAQPSLPAGQIVQANALQDSLGLFIDAQGFFPKVRPTGEKWLRGQTNQFGETWYFLRQDGSFVAWNGHRDAQGRKIADGLELFQFDPQVYLNPDPLL